MSSEQVEQVRAMQEQQKLEKQVYKHYNDCDLYIFLHLSTFHLLLFSSSLSLPLSSLPSSCFLSLSLSPTQAIESEEREREKEWNRRRIAEARAGLVLEAQLQRCKKDEVKKLAQENRKMAEEQLAR